MAIRYLLVSLILIGALRATGAEPSGNPIAATNGEKRVALVIGNGKYLRYPLKNPANDARDMATALRRIGFDVIEKIDANQKEMNRAIALFGSRLASNSVALFYYAGHGIQVKGKNYLIPIDAQFESENTVRAETVDVDILLDQLSSSPLNLVILDACRNNPFERRFRSVGGGLAQMDAPKGTLIAYSTSPGKVASDGEGRNGLYTQELLKVIQSPGVPVEQAFKRVRANVALSTGDNQIPWEASSLTGDFYFLPLRSRHSSVVSKETQDATEPQNRSWTLELAFWDSIKDSRNPNEYSAYLESYPNGRFQQLALARLKSLEKGASETVPSSDVASPSQPSTAKVYIIRPDRLSGLFLAPELSIDGTSIGEIRNGTYLAVDIAPGNYALVGKGLAYTMTRGLELSAGITYYIELNVGMQMIFLLPEAAGKAALAGAQFAKAVKIGSSAIGRSGLLESSVSEDKVGSLSSMPR